MVTVSLIVCIYYNVIMAYTVRYMVASFQSEVPWASCNPAWADMATCYVRGAASTVSFIGCASFVDVSVLVVTLVLT